nr:hypothetical protein [Crucivirus sp.]
MEDYGWVSDFEPLDQATDLIAEAFLILHEYKKELEKRDTFPKLKNIYNKIGDILKDLDVYDPNRDLSDAFLIKIKEIDGEPNLTKSQKQNLIMDKFEKSFGNNDIETHLDKMCLEDNENEMQS